MVVVEQALRARLDPLDRPAAAARRPEHQTLLRIGVALHAEAAANVLRDHPELRLGKVEHGLGQYGSGAVRILRARVKRVAVIGRVVVANGSAGLERVRREAVIEEPQRDDVAGPGERGVRRFFVAHGQREADVAGPVVPDLSRALLDGVLDPCHCRQRLVVDLDQFGGFPSLGGSGGHHECHALADVAHLIGDQDGPEGAEALGATHVLGNGQRRNPAEPFTRDIGAGEHADHARSGRGPRDIHVPDARVRVR